MKIQFGKGLLVALGIGYAVVSYARPPSSLEWCFDAKDPQNGLNEIVDGAIVEGSISYGGLQPDYLIDTDNELLKSLLDEAEHIGITNNDRTAVIAQIQQLIRRYVPGDQEAERAESAQSMCYTELMSQYRAPGCPKGCGACADCVPCPDACGSTHIPLSSYLSLNKVRGCSGHAVCRESAILTHLALKRAKIANRFVYARVELERKKPALLKDHAFNLVLFDGEHYVVDTYISAFNGFKFEDLRQRGAGHENPPQRLAISDSAPPFDLPWIAAMNNFPRIWIPNKAVGCDNLLTRVMRDTEEILKRK